MSPIRIIIWAAIVVFAGLLVWFRSSPQRPPATPTTAVPPAAGQPATGAAPPKEYFVKGIIEETPEPGGKIVRIRHEEIPGYMEAMTMPFDVKDPKELEGVKAGDKVLFRLLVTEDDGWIDRLSVLKSAEGVVPKAPSARLVRNVEPLNVGDLLPDYPLTNQFGKPFRTSDFKGQALALTFIFTRCPFPDFCPRMSKHMAEAHRLLSAQVGAPTNWHLLSLSFDVEFDTPETLRRYAQIHSGEAKNWTYATGALIEIDDITERFGLYFTREQGTFNFNHNLRTVVIDPHGRIHAIFIGNDWKPEELARKIIEAAEAPPEEGAASK